MKKELKIKKGNKTFMIPDDYIPRHCEGTDTYYPSAAAGGGNPKKYASYQNKAHGPFIWTYQNEDNPVWRFRNDLPYLDIDKESLEGKSILLSALTFLAPYDDYGYLSNLSIVSQLVNTQKGLVDIEKFIERIEQLEDIVDKMLARIEDPDLLMDVKNMLAIDTTNAEKRRGRKK